VCKQLRESKETHEFPRPRWCESLNIAASNPSALGFVIEQMTISWISTYGFYDLRKFKSKLREVLAFNGNHPELSELSEISGFDLCSPLTHNYPVVDCIMVPAHLDSKRARAVVAGVQITIYGTGPRLPL
jgi:hypothetical protein